MDPAELNEVCRLCPGSGGAEELMHVFDERLSVKNNMKEVILVTTGVEVLETDLISKKICQRCCTKTLQMFLFRQDALTQDRILRERCSRLLEDKGIRLPNTCVTIKRERRDSCGLFKRPKLEPNVSPPTTAKVKPKKILHPSVMDIYKNYPHIKLPKKCLERHLDPVVSCTMGDVENYFKLRQLDMRNFIYRPVSKRPSSNVAKKRTSFPTKQKTVSPIKISKKVLENSDLYHAGTNINYVCTSVHKVKEKKKSFSSLDIEGHLPSTTPNENKATQSQPFTELMETPKQSKFCNKIYPEQTPVSQAPVPNHQPLETVTPTVPTSVHPIPDNNQEDSLIGTSKPKFIESLGLTPTVTATKSKTLHVCNLCGSVHNNAFKLKTHTRKHMVCQFCKLRFKSLETKQDHVDNSCQVKIMINSSGAVVELEKIHLNLEIRKKFRDAFFDFEAIPGLTELKDTEQVQVKAESIPSRLDIDGVISLSDNEGAQTRSSDPPSAAPPSSSNTLLSESVAVIRPDVRIKNNSVVDNIANNENDRQTVIDLLKLIKPRKKTVDKVLQTNLPATKDIKINNAEGFCEFKNLGEQLLSYQIPISIIDGPFHVGYQYKTNLTPVRTMALWDDLPVIDKCEKNLSKQSGNTLSLTNSSGGKIAANSQVQSSHVSFTKQPNVPFNISGVASNENKSFSVSTDASTSATPLLQNVTQTATPTRTNKPVPIPTVFAKSSVDHSVNTSRRSLPTVGKKASSIITRKSLSSNVSRNVGAASVKGSYSPARSKVSSSVASSNTTANSTRPIKESASLASETSRFRVKNVWELQ